MSYRVVLSRFWLSFALVLALIQPASAIIDASLQMQLGNPSGATANTNNHAHYLLQRPVQALDYSDNLGQPVWAAWDLTAEDVGTAPRNTSYYQDTNLPPNFNRLTTSDYNGVGTILFNRGHLCPSEDRTDTTNDNRMVFFMSNIMPQSAANNAGPWEKFEIYCRNMLTTNELLIQCGPSGFGAAKLPSGQAYIPSNSWKVVVCVPLGSGTALSRITPQARVIAISIPNWTNGLSTNWQSYVTTPKQIERDTGLTFFTALPAATAESFRNQLDGTPIISRAVNTNNQFRFYVDGWPGTNYVVQSSTDLNGSNWQPVSTNSAPFTFSQTNPPTGGIRFYRVKL